MTGLRLVLHTALLTGGMIIPPVFIPFAWAVDAPDPCKTIYEEIVPLRVPDFDQSALWKKTSGITGIERPRSIMGIVDGGQIAIGSSTAYDEKTGLAAPKIQMVRTDKNGKVIVEKWVPVKGMKTVADAILLKDKVVVLTQVGDKDHDGIELHYLNGIGEEKSVKSISDKKLKLIPKSLMSVPGGTQVVIAAEAVSVKNPKDSYAVLIWVDKDGNKVTQKEYLPGVINKPEYVGRLDDGEIVMTGRVMDEYGRDAGWVLRLSQKGDILYQRPYARGGDSVVRRAVALGNGEMVVVGDALPAREGDKAAWVMRLDREGNPVWQKYLTGKYSYAGVDIIKTGDGRLNVLLAGKPVGEGGRDYARIVTMSLDGVVIGDESFIEGSNAVPVRLIDQKGKRYMVGIAETGFTKADTPEELKYITYDTWILAPGALPEFKDSCAGAPDRTLDDLP